MPYTSINVTNYNSNPPPDDGSSSSTNQITWSAIKTKLTDPLKNAIEAINSGVNTAVSTLETAFFEAGTKMVFLQSAAPVNWTKLTNEIYNNAAFRVVIGTAGTGGSTDFTTVFTDRTFTLVQANLPNITFAHSLFAAAHYHNAGSLNVPEHYDYSGSADVLIAEGGETFLRNFGTGTQQQGIYSPATAVTGYTDWVEPLEVSGTIYSGGSSQPVSLNFAVKYVDVILAQRDA